MARRPRVQIEGLRELRRHLADFTGGVEDLRGLHADAASIVERAALPLVPQRTGRLAGTIRSTGTRTGGRVRAGFARVPYAGVIHFGWPGHNIAPQSFLYDAADRSETRVLNVYYFGIEGLRRRYHL